MIRSRATAPRPGGSLARLTGVGGDVNQRSAAALRDVGAVGVAERGRRASFVDIGWSLRRLRRLRDIDWTARSLDDGLIDTLSAAFAGVYDRYFRMEVRGWEHIPLSPALLVGNHSGFGVAELLMLLIAWQRRFGATRPRYALAHRWLFTTRFLRTGPRPLCRTRARGLPRR
jgi:hypothetical protein